MTLADADAPCHTAPDWGLDLSDTGDIPLALSPDAVPAFVLDDDGDVPDWRDASGRFLRRLHGDSPHTPRFGDEWARQVRARLLRADETARRWAGTTTLLTFTGSPYLPGTDQLMPPMRYWDGLTASRPGRRRALRDVLDDVGRWITVRVVGASESGYPHEHTLVYTEADTSAVDFESVVSAHVDGSPVAEHDAHGAGAVSVESDPRRDGPTGGIAYSITNLPGGRAVFNADDGPGRPAVGGVTAEARHRVRTATVLEAHGGDAVSIQSADGVDADWW